jgi:predicted membrane chloride channel (bestrophin family)
MNRDEIMKVLVKMTAFFYWCHFLEKDFTKKQMSYLSTSKILETPIPYIWSCLLKRITFYSSFFILFIMKVTM